MDRGAGSNEDFSCLNTEHQSSGYSGIYRRDTEVYKIQNTVEYIGGIQRYIRYRIQWNV